MYDIKWLRENGDIFDAGMDRRGLDKPRSKKILDLDLDLRNSISIVQVAQERRNAASKLIGQAMSAKDMAKVESLKAEVVEWKDTISEGEAERARLEVELRELLAGIPNLPKDDVPEGGDEHGNVEYRRHGETPNLAFAPKQHFELGEALGLMDFEAASRMSGARFVVLKGALARLERALGQFFLDTHTSENGYTEVNPPLLVRDEAMFGTAQLPKFLDDQFATLKGEKCEEAYLHNARSGWLGALAHIEERGLESAKEFVDAGNWAFVNSNELPFDFFGRLWLIPTAEVPLTNLVRESILADTELPKRFTALTPCFRAEAGSAGRDTRGMLRQHQFNKVELVSITTPEESAAEHERMLTCAESVLKKLNLHYRVMTLCTGDMGFGSQKTYDIEVWMPGQDTYREISSCSVCGDFQARRMGARYKGKDGKTQFVHTLNGSGVAVGRALIAVMENYQTADGSIEIPEVLQPYMGGLARIEKAA